MNNQTGIVYGLTGDRSRSRVHGYHGKPNPLTLNKSKYKVDVAGLKPTALRNTIKFDGSDYTTKYTIGMEVEKCDLHRGAIKEYELFCGFEEDSSCGFEAVTHILPLLPKSQWRNKVFDMVYKAEKIIDDNYSASNGSCGGHITIGVEGMTGDDIREAVRVNCGIVLALFRHRLKNKYCGANRRMQARGLREYNSADFDYVYDSNGWHWKYHTALVKGNVLEFRVVSRFQSVKQTMRRYELFYELVDFSINRPNGSHESFLKTIRPIVLSMYNGNEEDCDKIMKLAKHFRTFILSGEVHQDIARYL